MGFSKKLVFLGLLLAVSARGEAKLETLDRIAAVVNGSPILLSEINTKVSKGILVSVSEFPAAENASPFEKALQDAINFELVMQQARELDIDVHEDEVESEIKSFLESRGLARDGLMEHLQQQGMSYEEYKEDFRDQMILRRFQGRVIAPSVKITEKDIETYYLKTSGTSSGVIEIVLRQVLFAAPGNASSEFLEQKSKLAQEVYKKISDGMSFTDAVKIYSDDPKARETEGLMLGMKLKDLAPAIRQRVESLDAGRFTEPVRTGLGFHIFKVEERKIAANDEYKKKSKQLENELRSIELADQTKRWLSDRRQRSKIEIIKD